ncbi:MAG: hypothetical protein E7294_06075 [Lachnospiraceae bacterium]|nr:hypothetical protein [Lachnospiraceae bacterium]
MKVSLFMQDIREYLKFDAEIDFNHLSVNKPADQLYDESENETDYIRRAYEYDHEYTAYEVSGEERTH